MSPQVSGGVADLSGAQVGNSASSCGFLWAWLLVTGRAQVCPCVFILRLAEGTGATQGKLFSGNTETKEIELHCASTFLVFASILPFHIPRVTASHVAEPTVKGKESTLPF